MREHVQTAMAGLVRAAQYVRMSTEHQQYYTENQADILTVSCTYIERLLENRWAERHLSKHHPDILNALRGLISEVAPEKAESLAS
jgi:hypothetical protein